MWSVECGPGQAAHAEHPPSVPWPLAPVPGVGVIAIIVITFSQFPPSPHSQPVITQPSPGSQATYANQTRAQMSRLQRRVRDGRPGWWCLMWDHPPPKPLSSGCKVCSNTNIDSARRPKLSAQTFITDHHSLSWFLFTDACVSHEAWCRCILTPISIFPLDNHPSPLSILYRYRVSSPWQKSVSGRGNCFRKTNEVHVNFLPVFRSNTMYSGYRVTKKQLKLSYFQRYRSSGFHEWGRVLNYFSYLLRLLELPFLLCQIMNFKFSSTLIMGLTDCRLLVHFDLMCLMITGLTRSINEWKMTPSVTGKIWTIIMSSKIQVIFGFEAPD